MNLFQLRSARLCVLVFFIVENLTAQTLPLQHKFSGSVREEFFYGDNVSLLNNNEASDKLFYARTYEDIKCNIYTAECPPLLEICLGVRGKAIWGDPNSIAATTNTPVKFSSALLQPHSHYIPRQIFWIREAWISSDVNELLSLRFFPASTVTFGAFSFQLGRGISLGDAYAVGPELLGFYTEAVVDQYAFGGKLSSEVLSDALYHDFYVAILNSKTSTLGQTAEKILSQEYGRRFNPGRGFGVINYLVAARLQWYPFDNSMLGTLCLEPYWLYNNDPEQTVQFFADASSKLVTLGLAGEYSNNAFEFGFDTAFNLGQQTVKSWDRNDVTIENRDGRPAFVNTHVIDSTTKLKIPFVSDTNPVQVQIYRAFDNKDSQNHNGQEITEVSSVGFVTAPPGGVIKVANNNSRFRNPYVNKYRGWMAVADAAWNLCDKQLQFAVAAGVASGDENPNLEHKDGDFSGFLGLQEIYSGKRVRSAFVLGGFGKLRRPLSVPTVEEAPSLFADNVSGFTNLIFCGVSSNWKPKGYEKSFSFNPNILAYWQEKPTHKFDAQLRRPIEDQLASTYLGVEANLFANFFPFTQLRLYFVGSVFVPGQHYSDIKGLPLTHDQNKALEEFNRTGFNRDLIPNLGDNVAYTFNIGMEFKF
jgi:hypothetical protein